VDEDVDNAQLSPTTFAAIASTEDRLDIHCHRDRRDAGRPHLIGAGTLGSATAAHATAARQR
jgi:hypothetical protein